MLFDENSQYATIEGSVGLRWLRRGPKRILRYKNLDICRIELKSLTLEDYDRILRPHKMINFLERYYSEPKLKLEDTEYWSLLAKRYTGNYKRELNASDFSRAKKRLRSFSTLCQGMKDYGWGKGAKGRSFESYVSILVDDDESGNILFNNLEKRLIDSGDRDRKKLIDGHHRLACAYYLQLEQVPTALHYIGRKR